MRAELRSDRCTPAWAEPAPRRADELLERLRLSHLAEANPFTLSGGEKRRLSVGTALAAAPRLMVLDEPTFGQDRGTWIELLHLLGGLRDGGRGICFVSHDRAFVNALADRTLVLGERPLMQLLTPIVPEPGAPLVRANPVAKLGAALVLLVALFASLDGVTALVVLAGLLALLPFSGVPVPRWPGAPGWSASARCRSVSSTSCSRPNRLGPTLVAIGPLRIGSETLVDGLGLICRLLAIALAGILATATSQPTELADALIQQLRVSPRFAVGALAALRLLPLMGLEWQTIAMARRARGVAPGARRSVRSGSSSGSCWRCWSGRCAARAGWPWPWRRAASVPCRAGPSRACST